MKSHVELAQAAVFILMAAQERHRNGVDAMEWFSARQFLTGLIVEGCSSCRQEATEALFGMWFL